MPNAEKRPSDFNDLHVLHGLDVVKDQLHAALALQDDTPVDDSPAPPVSEVPLCLDDLLQRYALAMPDAKVWDSHARKLIRQSAFKAFVGKQLFAEWLEPKEGTRRTVQIDDVKPEIVAAQKEGAGGLATALMRYVYLNPSSSAWDKDWREVVALADLRNAIAADYDQWLKHPLRLEIPKVNLVFDPTQSVHADTHINMFKGLPLEPDHDKNFEKSRCMRSMLYQLCNQDDDAYDWLCKWLAYPVQHVGAKMTTAVLMHSNVHGSGKSFFFDGVMRSVYGEYCRTFGQQQLESQYNDWISQTLFGVFEEVLSRSQRYSHTGTLKQMITGGKFRVEKKYIAGWEEANHMNCVFLSNEVQPLPVEPSDRRFLVIWPESTLLDELQKGVDRELSSGGGASFYAWLLSVDTTDFGPHTKPPMTEAKKRLIDFGRPGWEVFYDEWRRGELDVPYCSCLVGDLFKVFERWCTQNREHCMGKNKFSGFIASEERRRRDVDYVSRSKGDKAKGTFFIIHQCPDGKTQAEWLGGCVDAFDEVLNKLAAQEGANQ